MNHRFLQIGDSVVAIAHIVCVLLISDHEVRVITSESDESYLTFTGGEARAVWQWVTDTAHTTVLVPAPQPTKPQ